MKGISHFAAGVAMASCLPGVAAAGADGQPLYFVLGGCCGLLPDTLDFKFLRFFARHDIEVVPDPLAPDPQMIADAVAMAANEACARGRPVRIKLHAVQLSAGAWQSYEVAFDVARHAVRVRLGPVTEGGMARPAAPGCGEVPEGEAPLACELRLEYLARIAVDILDGPMLAFIPRGGREVLVRFLPWHRTWSHSFVTTAAIGLLLALLWSPLAALVGMLAHAAHVALDQTGFMGSCLFYPFVTRRYPGLQWTHSGEGLPNALAVWTAGVLVLWNLSRAAPHVPFPNALQLAVFGILLPLAAYRMLKRVWASE